MAEQTVLPTQPSATPQPPKLSLIDDLFDLVASENLETMLRQALKTAIKILGAEAGSIFFQTQVPYNIQAGAFKKDALAQILRWENAIGQRMQDNNWNAAKSNVPPVSTAVLAKSKIMLVSVLLPQKNRVAGLLSLALPPGHELPENQRGLLEKLGRGIGQIAALITEFELAQERINRISVFHDIGQALVTTFDISKLLLDAMELATKLVDAGAASIMMVDEEKRELVFRVSHGARAEMIRQQRIPIDEGIAGWVARNGRPVIANDARADARFSHRVDVRTGFLTQSIAAVPLKTKGRVIGVLEVLNKYSDFGFSQDDVQVMSFIASQAAIAIENARMYNQIKEERDRIIHSQENVYRKITGNLHDGTLQYLSAISLSLDHLSLLATKASPDVLQTQITALHNLVEQATKNTRNLLFELRPPMLESHGLVAALASYIDQLRNVSALNLHFKAVEHPGLSAKTSGIIFSVVQEAINNVIRHATATNVWLTLKFDNGNLLITIKDDGQGFDLAQINIETKPAALGISYMREQAEAINAQLILTSRMFPPDPGTTVQLILPVKAQLSEDKPQ